MTRAFTRSSAPPVPLILVCTVSSDSKTSAEEHTKQLYQELEEAHAELALFTSKGRGAIGPESHDIVHGCGSPRLSGGSEPEGMLARKISGMSSLFEEENSEHGKTPVSNVREGLSPLTYRTLMARAGRGLDSGSSNERVSSNHVEAPYSEQVCAQGIISGTVVLVVVVFSHSKFPPSRK